MSRTRKKSATRSAILEPGFWELYGLSEDSSSKEKLVALAMSEISRRGVLDVNARSLCDLLGVDYSLITYHFGSFDGLLAEAFVEAHEIWIKSIKAALSGRYLTPEDRMRAVLNAQIERAIKYGMVIGIAHLPQVSENVTRILDEKFPAQIATAVGYSVGVTSLLVSDLKNGKVTEYDFDLFLNPEHVLNSEYSGGFPVAVRIQWALVGPTLWMTGAGGGYKEISDFSDQINFAELVNSYIDSLILSAKTSEI